MFFPPHLNFLSQASVPLAFYTEGGRSARHALDHRYRLFFRYRYRLDQSPHRF